MKRLIGQVSGVSRLVFAVLAAALLAGCATSGVTYADLQPKLAAPAEGQGRIFIYRTAIVGAAVQPAVKVNDAVVGSAVPRGFIYLDRPAGDYMITTATEVTRTLSRLSPRVKFAMFDWELAWVSSWGTCIPNLWTIQRASPISPVAIW